MPRLTSLPLLAALALATAALGTLTNPPAAFGTPTELEAKSRLQSGTPTNSGGMQSGTPTNSGMQSGTPTNSGAMADAETGEIGTSTELAHAVERNVAVRMRDGTVLRADIFRPPGRGPFPVLVYRTPYGKQAAAAAYQTHLKATERGYAVVLQDVRGRYASDGEFDPYRNEGLDGFDTIEWAAEQPWSDGRIGTFGLSYPGAVQWLAAVESPPNLMAMAPAMTFSSPRHFFYANGIFDLSWLSWIYQNVAPDRRVRDRLPGITDPEEARSTWPDVAAQYRSFRPLGELPFLRREAPFYFEWLEHPPEDPWWDWAELRSRYDKVDAAVLNLSGWFDEAYGPEGAVTNFNGLMAARTEDFEKRTYLVLGPWTHGVRATMSRRTGDLDFGPSAAIDYDELVLDFFDRHLKEDERKLQGAAVRYFVMGENRWRDASRWPPSEVSSKALYLHGRHGGERQLSWNLPGATRSASSFIADPDDPVVDPYPEFGPHDYQQLARRDDLLTFDTEPLREDLTVAGAIDAIIHASCNCIDFDLWIRIQDVWPDGRAMNVMSPGNDMLRASYREISGGRQLLQKGKAYELRLSKMLTAIRLGKGHRLRVQISASFAPHFSSNLQTGKSEIVSATAKPATIVIHHDSGHPSRLMLPLLPVTP